jgi:hypothetical protein
MIKKTLIFIFVLIFFFAVDAIAETPQEGAAAILKLLKNKNYNDL